MTDKELGNPENNPLDGSPKEDSNLEKSTSTENEVVESEIVDPAIVESEVIEPEIVEPEVVEPELIEPVVVTPEFENNVDVNESTLNTEEAIVPQPIDDQYVTENASAPVPPSKNNTSRNIWMGLSLVLAIVLVIVLVKPSSDNAAVATVNGVDITKDKLYSELVTLGGTQTLDNLITEELIDQEVKKANITVTEKDLTKEIESVKKNFATEEEFTAALTQSGMTIEDLKNEMEIQVKIRKLVEPQVKEVTDADIKKFFDENPGAYDTADHKATLEEKSAEIKEQLTATQISTLSSTWLADLKTKADIKNTLDKESTEETTDTTPATPATPDTKK